MVFVASSCRYRSQPRIGLPQAPTEPGLTRIPSVVPHPSLLERTTSLRLKRLATHWFPWVADYSAPAASQPLPTLLPAYSACYAEACEGAFHCRLSWMDSEAKTAGSWKLQFDMCRVCSQAGVLHSDGIRRFLADAKLHSKDCGSAEMDRLAADCLAPVATMGPENVRTRAADGKWAGWCQRGISGVILSPRCLCPLLSTPCGRHVACKRASDQAEPDLLHHFRPCSFPSAPAPTPGPRRIPNTANRRRRTTPSGGGRHRQTGRRKRTSTKRRWFTTRRKGRWGSTSGWS